MIAASTVKNSHAAPNTAVAKKSFSPPCVMDNALFLTFPNRPTFLLATDHQAKELINSILDWFLLGTGVIVVVWALNLRFREKEFNSKQNWVSLAMGFLVIARGTLGLLGLID